jgi:hypothetical protein
MGVCAHHVRGQPGVQQGRTCWPKAAACHADAAVAHPALLWVLLLVAVGAQPGARSHLLTHVLQQQQCGSRA